MPKELSSALVKRMGLELALKQIVFNRKSRQWLKDNDPKALEVAECALGYEPGEIDWLLYKFPPLP